MTLCPACGKAILFGGKEVQGSRVCNEKCAAALTTAIAAAKVPESAAQERAQAIRTGTCPRCGGTGQPIEVQQAHRCLSFLVVTRRSTQTLVACHSCGNRLRIRESLLTLVGGWWGFPWGLIFTPVQIGRNILMMFAAPSVGPSPELVAVARRALAKESAPELPGAV